MIAKVVHKDPGAPTSTQVGGGEVTLHIIITWCVAVVCSCIRVCVCGYGFGCGLTRLVFGLLVSYMVLLTQKHVLPLQTTFLD